MSYARRKLIFDPDSKEPFQMSRSKIDLFIQCPRCFYLDQRLGIKRPSFPAFTLNVAVDNLLKKEFDFHRVSGQPHPLMQTYGIEAVPFEHPKMDEWRENFIGLRFHHKPTNIIIFGAVDDIWVTKNKVLVVVDYKATSTTRKIDLQDKWKQAYKRQIEIYQWLLRKQEDLKKQGYRVSDKGFFIYANGRKDRKAFDAKLEFDVQILPYLGDDSWVENKIIEAHECLLKDEIPEPGEECEYCYYRQKAAGAEKWNKK